MLTYSLYIAAQFYPAFSTLHKESDMRHLLAEVPDLTGHTGIAAVCDRKEFWENCPALQAGIGQTAHFH